MKPRFHYGVDGMLRLCNGSATVSTEREALDRLCVRLNMYLVTNKIVLKVQKKKRIKPKTHTQKQKTHKEQAAVTASRSLYNTLSC